MMQLNGSSFLTKSLIFKISNSHNFLHCIRLTSWSDIPKKLICSRQHTDRDRRGSSRLQSLYIRRRVYRARAYLLLYTHEHARTYFIIRERAIMIGERGIFYARAFSTHPRLVYILACVCGCIGIYARAHPPRLDSGLLVFLIREVLSEKRAEAMLMSVSILTCCNDWIATLWSLPRTQMI